MQDQHSLKPGTLLNHYKIIKVLGEGGFGITYLAKDTEIGLEVVIKEYFPNEFAMRSVNSTITAKSKSMGDFSKGKQRFKEEAQTLAKFSHPSIVKILGYFEANDTAYFVMEYEEGIDLANYIKQNGTPLSQEEILSIMMPILEGLKEVHAHNYLHRDIKPGNILLRTNRTPVLIDFGASKLAIGEASKSITSMLTEGYAPLEQYSTDIKQQGPFTDLYAVAAVMYKMITGEVPPSAQTRSYQLLQDGNDPFEPLSTMKLKGYDINFLKAIDRALSLKAKERPQNVQEFQGDIAGEVRKEQKSAALTGKNRSGEKPKSNAAVISIVAVLVVVGSIFGFVTMQNKEKAAADEPVNTVKVVKTDTADSAKKTEGCDGADVSECYKVGVQYLNGDSVTKDEGKAKKFFETACSNGDMKGCTGLGLTYAKGIGVDRDEKKAFNFFKKACDGNNAEGCYNLGYLYDKGKGLAQDSKKGTEYYKSACNNGLPKSCYRLGGKYLKGDGVRQDYSKAKSLFAKACDGGEARGCTGLGVIFAKGLGGQKNYKEAKRYFQKACIGGNAKGCFNLAKLYSKGIGVVKNLEEAKKYYQMSCDKGYQNACSVLEKK